MDFSNPFNSARSAGMGQEAVLDSQFSFCADQARQRKSLVGLIIALDVYRHLELKNGRKLRDSTVHEYIQDLRRGLF
jgi:hypothetical protein